MTQPPEPPPRKRPLPAPAPAPAPTGGKRRALPTCLQQRTAPPPQQQPRPPPLQQHRQPQPQPHQQQLPFMRFQGALSYVAGDAQARGFDHEVNSPCIRMIDSSLRR